MILVAGYCRVSTDKEDQANSYENQQQYFRDYIRARPDWELYEIYADQGITGTSTKGRTQFNRMLRDAREGRFRLILTKEVSRFSRNILDTIRYTRELKAMGVGVLFLNDRIHTLEPESEMLLSFLASLAQEESRRTSSRVVWGQTRQMEKGVVFGRSLLGYDVAEGRLSVNEEGARIVRLIFHKYALEQMGTTKIAAYLTAIGARNLSGNTCWKPRDIIRILHNEKYAGDLVQKKTYTPDFLTHEKKVNKGQVPFVTLENHHEPIISRELWNQAQARLKRNNKHSGRKESHSDSFVFSGKIRCGECGSCFVVRYKYRKDGTRLRCWSCAAAAREGSTACQVGKLLRDDDAMQMLKTAIRSLPLDVDAIVREVADLALEAMGAAERDALQEQRLLQREIDRLQRKKEAVLDSCFSGEIPKEDMLAMNRRYDSQKQALQQRLQKATQQSIRDPEALAPVLREEVKGILMGEGENDVFYKSVLDSLTVFRDRHMELRLKDLLLVFHFTG